MLNNCPNCLIKDYVIDFLKSGSNETSHEKNVNCMQWTKSAGEKGVQRISLVEISELYIEALESLVDDLLGTPKTASMIKHHFIATE